MADWNGDWAMAEYYVERLWSPTAPKMRAWRRYANVADCGAGSGGFWLILSYFGGSW